MKLPFHLELRAPWFLCLALSALPVWLLARRHAGRLRFSSLTLLPARGATWRTRLAWAPAALWALGAIGLGVAAAGPRLPDRAAPIQRRGIAIMMVLDISGSMRALDLSPPGREDSRLDAAKQVFADFVFGAGELEGRPHDVVGVVSFARYAETRAPLTLDRDTLRQVVDQLTIVERQDDDGTALGDGLELAVERLHRFEATSKVAIVLTDGVQNAGDSEPLAAAEVARKLGVKVYTVGAGTRGLARVRVQDPFSGRSVLQGMPVDIDEKTLEEMAARTGGRYFRATDAAELRRVYQEIDGLTRSKLEEARWSRWHDLYPWAAGFGLGALALAWLLGATVLRRLP